jgi:hypothetical protein
VRPANTVRAVQVLPPVVDAASGTGLAKVAVNCAGGVHFTDMPGLTARGARLKCDHASFCLADVSGVREFMLDVVGHVWPFGDCDRPVFVVDLRSCRADATGRARS